MFHTRLFVNIRWCVDFCSSASRFGVRYVETHLYLASGMFMKTVYLAKICLGTLMSSMRYVRHTILVYCMSSNNPYLTNVCSGTTLSSK